mgnify:CR=1 FL=1
MIIHNRQHSQEKDLSLLVNLHISTLFSVENLHLLYTAIVNNVDNCVSIERPAFMNVNKSEPKPQNSQYTLKVNKCIYLFVNTLHNSYTFQKQREI